jgi:hypothetical protein
MKKILTLLAVTAAASLAACSEAPEVEAVETVEVPATDEAVEEEPAMEPTNTNEENVRPK